MKVESNVYYEPSKSNLEIFEFIDTGESYEFNMFVIFKEMTYQTLHYAMDSGCSCPTPFEDIHEIMDITKDTLYNFERALENHYNVPQEQFLRIRNTVKKHLDMHEGGVINNAQEFFNY